MAASTPSPRIHGPIPLLALGILYATGVAYFFHQNQPDRLGGPITMENALWLTYALATWFMLPCAFWLNRRVPPVLRRLYGLFFLGFMIRGVGELYLMYGPKAWVPPIGIGHDLVMILMLLGLRWRWREELAALTNPVHRRMHWFLNVMMVALGCEMLFAWMFYVAVEFRTDFLWFADNSPRFATLTPLMRTAVIGVHLDLVLMLLTFYWPKALAKLRFKAPAA